MMMLATSFTATSRMFPMLANTAMTIRPRIMSGSWGLQREKFFLNDFKVEDAINQLPKGLELIGRHGRHVVLCEAKLWVGSTSEVRLRSLLNGHDGGGLETQVSLEILSVLTDQTLERQLADQRLSGLGIDVGAVTGEGHDGRGLETQVSLEVLSNLTDKTLERQLVD